MINWYGIKNDGVEKEFAGFPGPPASQARLCWRPWPCKACSGGVTALSYLIKRAQAIPAVQPVIPEKIALQQVTFLIEWMGKCAHLPEKTIYLPIIGRGSEHLVLLSTQDAIVYKATHQNIYGESYYIENNRMHQRNCSPLDYLFRLRLWKILFQSAPRDLGITDKGQIISQHRYITGDPPSETEINNFLETSGFQAVKKQYWLWKKVYKGLEIWLGDARPDNFIKTPNGIVPIDIRLWLED